MWLAWDALAARGFGVETGRNSGGASANIYGEPFTTIRRLAETEPCALALAAYAALTEAQHHA